MLPSSQLAGSQGAREQSSFVEFLLRLCTARETGVLYAGRGSMERTFHLRQGQCIFATSNDADDGLVSFLLRRGVISLRDSVLDASSGDRSPGGARDPGQVLCRLSQ